MAEEKIIELTTVKQSNKKFIIVLITAIVMLLAAVAFLVLYLIKPTAPAADTSAVSNITFNSGNLFTRPSTGGGENIDKTENVASVGHKYDLYFDIDVSRADVSTAVRTSCSPADALKSVEITAVNSDVSESSDIITQRYRVTFEPESAYADGVTPITLNVFSAVDTTKAVSVVFKIAQVNTQFISLSGKVNSSIQDNSTQSIEIPAYVDDVFNTQWEVAIAQHGESNGESFASVSSLFNPDTRHYSDDIRLEVVTDEGTQIVEEGNAASLNFLEIALDGKAIKFKASSINRVGSATVNIIANNYNNADIVRKSFNISVTESEDPKFNYITQIKFSNSVITYDNIESVEAADTLNLVATDTSYVITDHIFVNPLSVMYTEEGALIGDWFANLEFTVGDTSVLRVAKSEGSVRFTQAYVGETTLTITDKTPGSPGVSLTINVIVLARIQAINLSISTSNSFTTSNYSGTVVATSVNTNSGGTIYMCAAYNVVLSYDDYSANDVLNYMNSAFTIEALGSLPDYLTITAPVRFAKVSSDNVYAFGDIAQHETVSTEKANTSMYVVAVFTLKLADNTPGGEYTLNYVKSGIPYGTAAQPDRTSVSDSTSTTSLKINVAGNASSFEFIPIDDIKAFIDRNDNYVHDATLSEDKQQLTLILNMRTGSAFSLNDLFVPNVDGAAITLSYKLGSSGSVTIDNSTANKGVISFNEEGVLGRTTYTVTATNSSNNTITGKYTIVIETVDAVSAIYTDAHASYTYESTISPGTALTLLESGDISLIYAKSPTTRVPYNKAITTISIPLIKNGEKVYEVLDSSANSGNGTVYSYNHNSTIYNLFRRDAANKIELIYDLTKFYVETGIAINDVHIEFAVDSTILNAEASNGFKYNAGLAHTETELKFSRVLDGFSVFSDNTLTKEFTASSIVMGPGTSTELYLIPTVTVGDDTRNVSELADSINFDKIKTEQFSASFGVSDPFTVTPTVVTERLGVTRLLFNAATGAQDLSKDTLTIKYNARTVAEKQIEFSINRSTLKVANIKVRRVINGGGDDTIDDGTVPVSALVFNTAGNMNITLRVTITYVNNVNDAFMFEEVKVSVPAWLGASAVTIVNPTQKPIQDSTNVYSTDVTFTLDSGVISYGEGVIRFDPASTSGLDQSIPVSAKTGVTGYTHDNFSESTNVSEKTIIDSSNGQAINHKGYLVMAKDNLATTTVKSVYTPTKSAAAYPVDILFDVESLEVNRLGDPNISAVGETVDGKLNITLTFAAGTPVGIYKVSYDIKDNVSGNITTYTYWFELSYEIYQISADKGALNFTTNNLSSGTHTEAQTLSFTFNNSAANFLPNRVDGDLEIGFVEKNDLGDAFINYDTTPNIKNQIQVVRSKTNNVTVGVNIAAVMTTYDFNYNFIVRVKSNPGVYTIVTITVTNTDRAIALADASDSRDNVTIGTVNADYTYDTSSKFSIVDLLGKKDSSYTLAREDTLTYSLANAVTGVSVDPATGVVTIGNDFDQSVATNVKVVASFYKRSSNKTTTATYEIIVTVEFDTVLTINAELTSTSLFIGEKRVITSRLANNHYRKIAYPTAIFGEVNVAIINSGVLGYTAESSEFSAKAKGSSNVTFTSASKTGVSKEITFTVENASLNDLQWGLDGTNSKSYNVADLLNAATASIEFAATAKVSMPNDASITSAKLTYSGDVKPSAFTVTGSDINSFKVALDAKKLTANDYKTHKFILTVVVTRNSVSQMLTGEFEITLTFNATLAPTVKVNYGSTQIVSVINKSYGNSYTASVGCEQTKYASYSLTSDNSGVITIGEFVNDKFNLTIGNLGNAKLKPSMTVFGQKFDGVAIGYTVQIDSSYVLDAVVSENDLSDGTDEPTDINNAVNLDSGVGSAEKTIYLYIDITKFNGNYNKDGVIISSSSDVAKIASSHSEVTVNGTTYLKQGITVVGVGAFTLTATVRDNSGIAYSIASYAVVASATNPTFSASGSLSVVGGTSIVLNTSADRSITYYTVKSATLGTNSNFAAPQINDKKITVNTSVIKEQQSVVLTVVYLVNSGVFSGQTYTYTYGLHTVPATVDTYTGKDVNANTKTEHTFSDLFDKTADGNVNSTVTYEVVGARGLVSGDDYTTTANGIKFSNRTLNYLRGFVLTVKQTVKSDSTYGIEVHNLAYLTSDPVGIVITYDGNGEDNGSMGSSTVNYASNNVGLRANAFSRANYTFGGWSTKTDGKVEFGSSFTANAVYTLGESNDALTLYAVWVPNVYMVSFNSMGGSAVESEAYTYNAGVGYTVTRSNPTRASFTFVGWFTDAICETAYKTTAITADTVLYAKWQGQETYSITKDGTHATITVTDDKVTITNGQSFSFTVKPDDGYTVSSVNVTNAIMSIVSSNNGVVTYQATNVTGDVRIVAVATINSYTVTLEYDSSDANSSLIVKYGSSAVKPVSNPVKAGYAFKGWCEVVEGMPAANEYDWSTKITKDVTIRAIWAKLYTFSFSGDNVTVNCTNGALVNNKIVLEGGETLSFTVSANTGYTLDTVKANGSLLTAHSGTYTFAASGDVVEINIVITSHVNSYAVTVQDGNNRTVNTSASSIAHFASFTFTVKPETGYHITNVQVTNGTLSGENGSYVVSNVSGDVSITAEVAINEYTVTVEFDNDTNNRVTTVNHGSTTTMPQPPTKTGYTFDGWYVVIDGIMTTAVYKWENPVLANLTIRAKWVIRYTVSITAAPSGEYTVDVIGLSGGSPYTLDSGTIFRFTVEAGVGKNITLVKYGNNTLTADNVGVYSFVVNDNYTVTVQTENTAYAVEVVGGVNDTTSTNRLVTIKEADNLYYGGTFKFSVVPRTGYRITKVEVMGGTLSGNNGTYTVSSVTSNVTITVEVSNIYYVGFDLDYDAAPEIATQNIEHGKMATDPKPTRSGYTFKGWYIFGDSSQKVYEFTKAVTEDITLVALWITQREVTVSAGANVTINVSAAGKVYSVTQLSSEKVLYDEGTVVTFTVSYATGFEKDEVALSSGTLANNQGTYSFTLSSNAVTVTATAKAKTFSVTKNVTAAAFVGGEDGVELSGTPTYGKPFTFSFTLVQGYKITGVAVTGGMLNGNKGNTYYVTDVDGDITITITTSNTYTVTYVYNNGSANVSETVVYNSTLTAPNDPSFANHAFRGWVSGGTKYTFDTPVTEDITITATWVKVYELTVPNNFSNATFKVNVAGGGDRTLLSGAVFSIAEDETAIITITPNTYYEVESFSCAHAIVALNADGTYRLSNVTVSGTLVLVISQPQYTVTVEYTADGTAMFAGGVGFTNNTKVTAGERSFSVTAKAGYEITTLIVNGKICGTDDSYDSYRKDAVTKKSCSLTVGGPLYITVITAPLTYYITYENAEPGNENMEVVNTNPTSYTVEDEVVLVEPTRNGYTFTKFVRKDTAADLAVGANLKGLTRDLTLTLHWELVSYTITYNWGTDNSSAVMKDSAVNYPTAYDVEFGSNVSISFGDLNAYSALNLYPQDDGKPFEMSSDIGAFTPFAVKTLTDKVYYGNITMTARWIPMTGQLVVRHSRYGDKTSVTGAKSASIDMNEIDAEANTLSSYSLNVSTENSISSYNFYNANYRLRTDKDLTVKLASRFAAVTFASHIVRIYHVNSFTSYTKTAISSTTDPKYYVTVDNYCLYKTYTAENGGANSFTIITIPASDLAKLQGKNIVISICTEKSGGGYAPSDFNGTMSGHTCDLNR